MDFHSTQGAATASEYVGGSSGSWDKVGAFLCTKLWLKDSADTWHSCKFLWGVSLVPLVWVFASQASSDRFHAWSFLANLNINIIFVEIEKGSNQRGLTRRRELSQGRSVVVEQEGRQRQCRLVWNSLSWQSRVGRGWQRQGWSEGRVLQARAKTSLDFSGQNWQCYFSLHILCCYLLHDTFDKEVVWKAPEDHEGKWNGQASTNVTNISHLGIQILVIYSQKVKITHQNCIQAFVSVCPDKLPKS